MIEVLDFYADWCGPCQMMKPIFAELEKDFAGKVKFTIINVDQHPEKSTEHSVLGIPTYIIQKDGQEVDRIVGFTPKPAFVAKLNAHLN
jgi:thioredoxin 1